MICYGSELTALQVQGNQLVTATGTPLILRGINALDPLIQVKNPDAGAGPWTEAYYAAMAAWGSNVVRLPIHPTSWRDTIPLSSLTILDQSITWAKIHKMYVIIDYHSIGLIHLDTYEKTDWHDYRTTKKEVIEFWKTIAAQYKDNPVVAAYEIFNEPVNLKTPTNMQDWLLWKSDAEEIITAIRAIDTHKIIIVGGLQWAYDLSPVANAPIADSNIVYAVHPYPGSNYNHSWDIAFGTLSEKYPLIATEVGFRLGEGSAAYYLNTYQPQKKESYTDALLPYLKKHNISWTAWNFSKYWDPPLLQDETDFTPNTAGRYFKNGLKDY